MKTIYLSGRISGCTDIEARGWREEVKAEYGDQYEFLDPMDRDFRLIEHEPGVAKIIVEGDKQDINASDVVLVYYVQPSVGTAMEVIFAWYLGKPVIIVTRQSLSPWMVYHSTEIVDSFESAFERIEAL
jgi:nucleoside 2-deoxyribosyltransferase